MKKKKRQERTEELQNFFLTKESISFSEIDWDCIINWINHLNLNHELSKLSLQFNLNSIQIFTENFEPLIHHGNQIDKDKLSAYFSSFGPIWVKDFNENEIIIGISTENAKGLRYFCPVTIDKSKFNLEDCQFLIKVFTLLTLSINHDKKIEKENIKKLNNNLGSFPVIKSGEIHVLRCSNLNNHLSQIKNTLVQIGLNPIVLSATKICLESSEKSDVIIINNIQNWEHLQQEFADKYSETTQAGHFPTLIFCFEGDPFYYYQQGRLIEQVFELTSKSHTQEFSQDLILEQQLDDQKLNELFEMTWVKNEKASA